MRIGELSTRTAVPVPTIKYYLREGLLPAGERTSPNQAQYGDAHVRRLKLVRALLDVGKLSVAATREVLASVDSPDSTLHHTLGTAQIAITPPVTPDPDSPAWQQAYERSEAVIARRGWRLEPGNPARDLLTQLVLTYHDLGEGDMLCVLDEYAAAAERIAAADIAAIGTRAEVDSKVEGAVLGTVLGDTLIAALRRLAQEDASARTFGPVTGRTASTAKPAEAPTGEPAPAG
ncbi:MerR family transcriptional regulator [Kitasatospora sp. NPDC050543]|uniref:MerR family transcriptional regulator n=1 Tax=Kitasatospora sp. NPDC050543 TaxID=3364054 RepID=UPI0037B0C253